MRDIHISGFSETPKRLLTLLSVTSIDNDGDGYIAKFNLKQSDAKERLDRALDLQVPVGFDARAHFMIALWEILEEEVWPEGVTQVYPDDVSVPDSVLEYAFKRLTERVHALETKIRSELGTSPNLTSNLEELRDQRNSLRELALDIVKMLERQDDEKYVENAGPSKIFATLKVEAFYEVADDIALQLKSYAIGTNSLADEQKVPAKRSALKALVRRFEAIRTGLIDFGRRSRTVIGMPGGKFLTDLLGLLKIIESESVDHLENIGTEDGQKRLLKAGLEQQVRELPELVQIVQALEPEACAS